jgi:hypothetical protein
MRNPDSKHGPFPEKTTRVITATVKDETGAVIPGASLTTMVYSLYDEDTLAIINSRTLVDIKANVTSGGVLTLELLPADMAVQTTSKDEERHRVLIEWTYAAGVKRGSYEAQVIVSNVEKV